MKTAELPPTSKSVVVSPRPIEVALSDDPTLNTLLLPPLEVMREIDDMRGESYSLSITSIHVSNALQDGFSEELVKAESKADIYADAPAFIYRLADLALLAGDRQKEHHYLEKARALGHPRYGLRRIGENFIAAGNEVDAEHIFQSFDLDTDDYANLRLAYFHVLRKEFDAAKARVSTAARIAPLSFSVRLFEGALFLAGGEHQRALRSFRIAEEERPNSSVLQANMALSYIRLKQESKALLCLKKAIAIDPLNKNAIALLADYAFERNKNEEAISCLRYFLTLERNDPEMWARLARGLVMLGERLEALAALKRQASLKEDGAVWNNLGAVYWSLDDFDKANRAFTKAIRISEGDSQDHYNLLFATRSLALSLIQAKQYNAVVHLVTHSLQWDTHHIVRSDRRLSDLYAALFAAQVGLGKLADAGGLAGGLLSDSGICLHLRAWMTTALIAAVVRENGEIDTALKLIEPGLQTLRALELDARHEADRQRLANNVAYLYAEAGQLENAQIVINTILNTVHKEPYATATLGLINLRKGHIERGIALYQSAHRVTASSSEKLQIRQKLNLEVGRALQHTDQRKALKALQKAADEKDGIAWYRKEAQRLLGALTGPRL